MKRLFVTIILLSMALLSPTTAVSSPAVPLLPPDNTIHEEQENGNSNAVPFLPRDNRTHGEQDRQTRQSVVFLRYYKQAAVIVWNPCNNLEALYMGLKGVFHTNDAFESTLYPIVYTSPGAALATSAAFTNTEVGSYIIFVVNGRASWTRRDLLWKKWFACEGVTYPVSHVSTEQCCLSMDDSHCKSVSSTVVLYQRGISDKHVIFLSKDGGLSYIPIVPSQPHIASKGLVGAVYIVGMSSRMVMAVVESGDPMLGQPNKFHLQTIGDSSETPLSDSYTMFDTVDRIEVIQPGGMRGHVIIWSPKMLFYSPNNGLAILPVYEVGTGKARILPLFPYLIMSVATGANGVIAFITNDASLYYGRLGLEASAIKFTTPMTSLNFAFTRGMLLAFNEYGDLDVMTPSKVALYTWSVKKERLGVEQQLYGEVIPCPVVQFFGDFDGKFYYMDIGGSIRLTVVYIPIPQCPFFPVVTLTNGDALNAEVELVVDGVTTVGYKKFKMEILINQKLSERGFIQDKKIALVNVDLMERGVACSKLDPKRAHIVVGCPPKKRLLISRDVTACTQGILSHAQLHNFTYNIPQEMYDPDFLSRPKVATSDLTILYNYMEFLCPLLVYHDMPWMPRFELWEDDTFVEYVNADFVLKEVHGMHNYQYLQTAKKAKCLSQPQDWISMIMQGKGWNRENYKSCKDRNGPPLTNPGAPYQVLNQEAKNRIGFSNYNGMYIFEATIVDPAYSYCQLRTTFSVYVYGAFPQRILPPGVLTAIFTAIFSGLLIIVFFIRRQSGSPEFRSF